MIKPCFECIHSEKKHGVAGGYYCNKKRALTSIARITDDGKTLPVGEAIECFEKKEK